VKFDLTFDKRGCKLRFSAEKPLSSGSFFENRIACMGLTTGNSHE